MIFVVVFIFCFLGKKKKDSFACFTYLTGVDNRYRKTLYSYEGKTCVWGVWQFCSNCPPTELTLCSWPFVNLSLTDILCFYRHESLAFQHQLGKWSWQNKLFQPNFQSSFFFWSDQLTVTLSLCCWWSTILSVKGLSQPLQLHVNKTAEPLHGLILLIRDISRLSKVGTSVIC